MMASLVSPLVLGFMIPPLPPPGNLHMTGLFFCHRAVADPFMPWSATLSAPFLADERFVDDLVPLAPVLQSAALALSLGGVVVFFATLSVLLGSATFQPTNPQLAAAVDGLRAVTSSGPFSSGHEQPEWPQTKDNLWEEQDELWEDE